MDMNEGSGPWWARVSLFVVISYMALFLIGAIPGIPSPFSRVEALIAGVTDHLITQQESVRLQHEALLGVSRLTCQGIWRGNETMQRQCSGFPTIDATTRGH